MSDSMKQRARHSTPHWFRSSDDTPQFDNKALRWSSDEWRQQPCFLQKARKEQSRGFQALNDPSWLKIKRNVSLGIEPPTVGRVVNPQEPLHKVPEPVLNPALKKRYALAGIKGVRWLAGPYFNKNYNGLGIGRRQPPDEPCKVPPLKGGD
mmetsp:Transcript_47885/g.74766  ORF Transcript_47885/g.74766 Transcript_47885/m.74766 type:complete len:151 (+) Transcript_47885:365-817(+)